MLATALILAAFAGSSFNWLGRSLYQETLLLPLFRALIYLHYFAPQRRALFIVLFTIGMLTREVFWIWRFVYAHITIRGRRVTRAGVACHLACFLRRAAILRRAPELVAGSQRTSMGTTDDGRPPVP